MSLEAYTTDWRKASISDISNITPLYDNNDIRKFSSEYSVRIAHAYLGDDQQQWTTYIHHDFPSIIKIKNIASRYKTTEDPKKCTVWIRFGDNINLMILLLIVLARVICILQVVLVLM